jgi:hypothetical protein
MTPADITTWREQEREMKIGTRIEVYGLDFDGREFWEPAKIARTAKTNRMEGWECVQFQDGGKLMVHHERMRVVDNRA